ncbi:LPS kinase [Streptomyces fumigatiscleroticus]|nr:LPS kinase [Streptomyces fumigatiscleroticus]
MALQISATNAEHPALLLELPWQLPLEEWPEKYLVPLPRGISRHVVRYARAGDEIIAVKELAERPAVREYGLLRDLDRLGIPAVDALAVVTGRTDDDGEPLEPVLVTRHLGGSMPYRSMFETTLRPATINRLMDALAVLLVRLHLAGFAWGDCSLSNTLFRRDAGAYAAYLVDAETGELHPRLSDGQRDYDLDLARVNISGELLDVEASGALHPAVDPVEFGNQICGRYQELWKELTRTSVYPAGKYHYIERRIRRLNDLGFDVAEMQIEHSSNGDTVTFVPKVVDAGHHQRQLLRLTGLDAEENQARRLLNDLESWMATQDDYSPGDRPPGSQLRSSGGHPHGARPEVLAHRWVRDVFRPTVRAVPPELRGAMDPAEIYHELLEHRWYLSERAQHDIGLDTAVADYIKNILPKVRETLRPTAE